jgi:hypothetical protein
MRNQGEEMSVCWAEYQRTHAIWRRAHNDAFAKALEEAAEKVRPLTVIRDRAYVAYNQSRGVGTAQAIVAPLEVVASGVPEFRGLRTMFRNIFRKTKNE